MYLKKVEKKHSDLAIVNDFVDDWLFFRFSLHTCT